MSVDILLAMRDEDENWNFQSTLCFSSAIEVSTTDDDDDDDDDEIKYTLETEQNNTINFLDLKATKKR